MGKILFSFRTRMILLLMASMLISGSITFAIYKVLQHYYRSEVLYEDPLAKIRYFMRDIGDVNSFLIIFIPLAILFFFLFTKSYASYFKKISKGIHQLAAGEFTHEVRISSKDEFGAIGADINLAMKKLQEAVERGDYAESSKDQLVLNLAHDLRTPLTSVIGYLDFILKDNEMSAEQARHYTTIAYTKSQRLQKLIDELFEITRMNYGRLNLDKKPFDLSELLMQLNEEFYPVFEKNDVTAKLSVDRELNICGNGELLARVFENLLTNAIRYGSEGGFIDIHGFVDMKDVVVQVINYGDCIDPKDLPHIFDMLYTGDQARTHPSGSTGIGLFITKNIVEQHEGTVTVQSSPIRTLFEVRLPLDTQTGTGSASSVISD
ncbi:HAMP domain-containing sensor histidine kinase [Paenibacillus dokdonensis]|uniref:histidine kinase n=1 Tax=Paenibacillus dokdonensis TaxID=2567944 RepID=A0ABU6GGZ5_9BACL|nr:HAMP domain-containing sensor histidine kinase [Paenibacillus dokdonensis]MEC0239026.1 HAMP domain-containing sensor histidine kinase [Paenibacillus dokdonensis]